MKEYFSCWYRLDRVDYYLIWYTNNCDGVVTDSTGLIPTFANIDSLVNYAKNLGLYIDKEEPILHNLDLIKYWLQNPNRDTVVCSDFLATWNLFTDVASSVRDVIFDRDLQKNNFIYKKLFWGNNLPAVTPLGKHYEPIWTDGEIETLAKVLGYGLTMFRRYLLHN